MAASASISHSTCPRAWLASARVTASAAGSRKTRPGRLSRSRFRSFSPGQVEQAKETLKHYHPQAYMAHFNVKLGPADSFKLEQLAWEEATRDNFVVTSGWGDGFWDVPAGYVYAAGFRGRDEATAGFLVPRSQYENRPGRLVLDGFQRWEPDRTLAYCKPTLAVGCHA